MMPSTYIRALPTSARSSYCTDAESRRIGAPPEGHPSRPILARVLARSLEEPGAMFTTRCRAEGVTEREGAALLREIGRADLIPARWQTEEERCEALFEALGSLPVPSVDGTGQGRRAVYPAKEAA